MTDYTEIFKAVIGLIVTVLTAIVIPAVKSYIEIKIDKEKLERWQRFIDIAVSAAEQTIPAENWREKKQFVVDWLDARGIDFDADEVDSMIESAVIKLHNELRS